MQVNVLNAKKVKEMIDNKEFDLIIDIRNSEFFENGHIPNAINIPINQIPDKIDVLYEYKDKAILLYCGIGSQSNSAGKVLIINGFTNIYSLSKGLKLYKYDLEKNE